MRILLVEDDPLLGDGVRSGLRQQGFAVDWVRDGWAAEREIASGDFAAVVLDLGLPGQDGRAVLHGVRARANATPILVLTARDAVSERIGALDDGADDYVVKPVDLFELGARLRALLRRASGHAAPVLTHGALTLDPAQRQVLLHGTAVVLSQREFDLLHALMRAGARVLTRELLEQQLYAWGSEVESNTIEVHIHHLRKKLGAEVIQTVRGVGYCLGAAP